MADDLQRDIEQLRIAMIDCDDPTCDNSCPEVTRVCDAAEKYIALRSAVDAAVKRLRGVPCLCEQGRKSRCVTCCVADDLERALVELK